MGCRLCSDEKYHYRTGEVRDAKELRILECEGCGLVYLSSVDHIDEKFYEDSNMHKEVDFSSGKTTPKLTMKDALLL